MSAVPKLRFPEFDEEWIECNVGDFCSFSKGKGISKSDIAEDGALPCIRYGELYTHYGVKIDEVASRTNIPAEALVLSKGGEVIIPASGETPEDISTAAVVIDCGVALGGDLNILRTTSDGYFLASYISGKARLRLASMAQGNSVVHLYGAQIASLEMCLPSLPEQQKIASFLSSVDKKIDLLRKKKDALELYKKGLMQKIFSQEIRFKKDDGSDFPDWEKVSLGDVVRIDSGFAFKSIKFKDRGANRVIRMSDLKDSEIAKTGGVYVEDYDVDGLERFKLAEADFVFGMSGSLSNYGWIKKSDLPSYLNQRVGRISDNGKGNALFFQYIYLLPETQKLIENSAVGAAQLNISIDFLRNMTFPCPAYEEQNKIAEFLSALDAKIQNISSQIDQMETFKKGLLQQMFV